MARWFSRAADSRAAAEASGSGIENIMDANLLFVSDAIMNQSKVKSVNFLGYNMRNDLWEQKRDLTPVDCRSSVAPQPSLAMTAIFPRNDGGYIKYFLLILSLFAVLACGDGNYSADGDSAWACYSPQSAIYNADINSDSEGSSRSTAAVRIVTFLDNNSTVYEVKVPEGSVITLPDIRAKHCFHGRENQILAGWNDKSDNYTTGGFYEVTKDVTFTSVWEEGVEIYNAAEFDNISDNLSGKYKLMRNIDLKDYKTAPGWTPIGDEDNLFTGRLYGNGYRIDNLTIDNKTGSVAGLFGAIGESAEIYDLNINLAEDGISLTTPITNKAVGALAGLIKYGNGSEIIIKNVRTSSGEIKADNCSTSGDRHLYAGGLVGGAVASPSFTGGAKIVLDNLSNSVPVSAAVSVNSCYAYLGGIIGGTDASVETTLTFAENYGNINLSDTSTITSLEVRAGGLIGWGGKIAVTAGANRGVVAINSAESSPYSGGIAGHIEGGGNSSIDNCSNDSADNISAESTGTYTSSFSGGIVGFMPNGSVTNNRNYDNVTATASSLSYAGGIAGRLNAGGAIKNNSNTGNVSAVSNNNSAYAGGIVGEFFNGTIENDNNTGDVYAESDGNFAYSGGIAGNMSGGTIKNDNNNGDVFAESNNRDAYSGGIAGNMSGGGLIENDNNTGDVSAKSTNKDAYSGGIAGNMSYSDIYNSNNTGKVEATSESGGDKAFSGGIAGRMEGGGTIENDNNMGGIYAESASSTAYSGGIVGQVNLEDTSAAINNNSNIGKVIATGDNASSGGVAGSIEVIGSLNNAEAQIEGNSNTGKVEADAFTSFAYSGGIAGRVTLTGTSPAATATIDNCSNTGSDNISASVSSTTSAPDPVAHSGGIVGYMEGGGSITNSHNSDNVTANISVTTGGTAYSGGIVGYSRITTSSIANSYATGDVKATAIANSYAGGLVGRIGSINATNSYATGDVTAGSSGDTYAGGLVGLMSNGSITNSYATGDVKATADTNSNSYAGGLVGRILGGSITSSVAANLRVEITRGIVDMGRIVGDTAFSIPVTNNFALDTMLDVGGSFNAGSAGHGVDKMDDLLKDQDTYEGTVSGDGGGGLGWEFGNSGDPIWKMPSGGGYPILYWQ